MFGNSEYGKSLESYVPQGKNNASRSFEIEEKLRVLGLYTDRILLNMIPPNTTHQVYRNQSFDLNQALRDVKGPYIEIGGPTYAEYWLGLRLTDSRRLSKKLFVSNLIPELWRDDKGNSHKLQGKIDFQADGSRLPFADSSVGGLFMSHLPYTEVEGILFEARRVIESNGIFFVQSVKEDALRLAELLGFKTQESWEYFNITQSLRGETPWFDAVLQMKDL